MYEEIYKIGGIDYYILYDVEMRCGITPEQQLGKTNLIVNYFYVAYRKLY